MRVAVRLYEGLLALLGLISGLLIGAIVVGITVDVAMRNTGLGSLAWVFELSEYAIYIVTLLGAPWVLRMGAHVRVDIVVQSLPRRAARIVETVADVLAFAACSAVVYYAAGVARVSLREGTPIIKVHFIFPQWWIYALMALALGLVAVEFARRIAAAWSTREGGARQ